MSLGGNDKLNAHFAKYGVKGSIVERYNSPAAALYRDMIIAMRDGTPIPTDIAPYEAEMAAETAAKAARASETPAERDARIRAETQERMRAKFGSEGLKNQSLGSSGGISGGSADGGGAGGGGAGLDDFFGVDFAAQCVCRCVRRGRRPAPRRPLPPPSSFAERRRSRRSRASRCPRRRMQRAWRRCAWPRAHASSGARSRNSSSARRSR